MVRSRANSLVVCCSTLSKGRGYSSLNKTRFFYPNALLIRRWFQQDHLLMPVWISRLNALLIRRWFQPMDLLNMIDPNKS